MKDVLDLARGWILLAEEDLEAARVLLEVTKTFGAMGFHAQQAVEKLLKAIVSLYGGVAPRTHELPSLYSLVRARRPAFELPDVDLEWLTDFGVAIRYGPDSRPDREEAERALELATRTPVIVQVHIRSASRPEET